MSTPVPDALGALLAEHADLERQLADPAVHADQVLARKLSRRYAELGPVARAINELVHARDELAAARELAAEDAGFAAEAESLAEQLPRLESRLTELLLPRDPHDGSDVVLEIKSGEGGEESALFAGDLLRMYLRYAERQGWRAEVLHATESELGGYKDVTVAVKSRASDQDGVWAQLKFEGGVHRVHHRVRPGVGQRQRQRTRAGAQVDHHRIGPVAQFGQAPVEQQIGFRARHEHAGTDAHGDRADGRPPGEVLQRNPLGALGDELADRLDHRRVDQRDHRQPGALHAKHVRGDQFGVRPGRVDAGLGQDSFGFQNGQPQRLALSVHAEEPPMASRSARSASRSAVSTPPSSPPSTWSRLYAL